MFNGKVGHVKKEREREKERGQTQEGLRNPQINIFEYIIH